VRDETVDLVYLDPPFKSDQDYNVLFQEQNGSRSQAQIKAFEDTWLKISHCLSSVVAELPTIGRYILVGHPMPGLEGRVPAVLPHAKTPWATGPCR
jgi:hypothetical protein